MSGDPEKTVDYAEKLRDFSRGARFDFAIWLLIVAMAAASFGLAHVPLGSFNSPSLWRSPPDRSASSAFFS